MRMATWNVNYRGRAVCRSLGRLAQDKEVDLLLLQEANPSSLHELTAAAGLDWAVTAFDAGAALPDGTGRRRVTAIAGRGHPPIAVGVLPELALPERMVFATLESDLGPLTVASYHAPPGVSWGLTKVHHAHDLLRWINQTEGPLVIGADPNTPKVDHPDPDLVRTHWHTGAPKLEGIPGDDVTFGGRPEHRLRDAYRVWLQDHPAELERITHARPQGPLATSHRTGKRRDREGTARRYDTLWISPELTTTSMTYHYKDAIEAGSDHALVTADLFPLKWATTTAAPCRL